MKAKKRVAAFIVLVLVCNIIFAANKDTIVYHKIPDQLKRSLALKIGFPYQASDQQIEGVVTTCFYVTPEGVVKINCINGHPILKEYVQKKMEMIHTKHDLGIANKPMIIRFRFENRSY